MCNLIISEQFIKKNLEKMDRSVNILVIGGYMRINNLINSV
jgi:hypothetical protein